MASQNNELKEEQLALTQTCSLESESDPDCTDIPCSYTDLPLTAEAFSLGLYLYYSRQYLSDQFPGERAVSSVLKMDVDIVNHCIEELKDFGVLTVHPDGTFTMSDDPGAEESQ